MMDALLTFTGFHDPYFKRLVDREEQPGPILSLLGMRFFDHIFPEFCTQISAMNTLQ